MKKILSIILASAMLLSVAGCDGNGGGKTAVKVEDAKYGTEYPIQSDNTLTYWMGLTSNITTSASNYGDLPVAKELNKRTGINVEYVHPSLTNKQEKFNLMVASGELTDIIDYHWDYYPGGPQKAIEDGLILPLNDYIKAYAPNLQKLLDENPELLKECTTPDGDIYALGTVMIDPRLYTTAGPILREDWLEELNLEIPETIEEWEVVLRAFKEKKGATAPLSVDLSAIIWGAFTGAFETKFDFYHIDGEVKYGPATPEYKEFLTLANKWYNEGLWDPNFSTIDTATKTANMINGVTGATWGALGGGIGTYMKAANEEGYSLTGAPYPTHKKGEKPMFGQYPAHFGTSIAISTQCKDIELAMKLLDYGYSEEGSLFFNFGTEGVSYNMVDGYPTYTEEITKNPDGLSMSQALQKYSQGGQGGPFVQDVRYLEQYASMPQQRSAWEKWPNTDSGKYNVSQKVFVDDEYSSEYATLMTDIETYATEMYVKFISGTESLDNYDKYIENMKKIGLDRLLEIKQIAFDKYQAK